MNPKFVIRVFVILLLGTFISVLHSCMMDEKEDPQNKKIEQEIIEISNSFLSENLVVSIRDEIDQRSQISDYDIYLDTLKSSLIALKAAVESTFSLDEFRQACIDFETNLSNMKSSQDMNCKLRELGLGYGKGAALELGFTGPMQAGITAGLELQGGGGVEIIYDFVNLERQIYIFSICTMGWEIGPGLSGIEANVGFTGFYDWFLGNEYGNLGENKFAGASRSAEWGLEVSLLELLGIPADVGVSIGTTKDLLVDCNGILNTSECFWDNPVESDKVKGISFGFEASAGIGIELIAAIKNEQVGFCHHSISGTYTNFAQNFYGRKIASFLMAAELLTGTIENGITIPPATVVDVAAAAAALIYGRANLEDCDLYQLPAVSTSVPTIIDQTSIICGGTVTSQGNSPVTARGVCWSTFQNPTVSGAHTTDGSGTGAFTSQITGLTSATSYYIRAYASNGAGTAYGNQLYFTTSFDIVTDIDGNEYLPVQIGTQAWLRENLNVTHYNNGEQIPNVPDQAMWFGLATGAYVNYNNDQSYASTYGRLYNFFAATDVRNICPAGWHVPSYDEWHTLLSYLGGVTIAGGKMKAIGTIEQGNGLWYSPNFYASNSSGFTGLPGGIRDDWYDFSILGYEGVFWSSSEFSYDYSRVTILKYNNAVADELTGRKTFGASVRCLKD